MNVLDFMRCKKERRKISMITSYDYWSARIAAKSDVDCILVGDSLAMVMYGNPTTLAATTEMMARHIRAVSLGAPEKFIIGDMPFLSFRKGLIGAMESVGELMRAGAHAVKLEGVWGHEDVVGHIVQSGVPVMGHLGLTPQSIHQLGGFRVQGRDKETATDLVTQARKLEELGCFALVLECIPADIASEITRSVEIPTIGIGAGAGVDGQVLVFQDLLGMNKEFKPKFLKHFLNGEGLITDALNRFDKEVKEGIFPTEQETYQ